MMNNGMYAEIDGEQDFDNEDSEALLVQTELEGKVKDFFGDLFGTKKSKPKPAEVAKAATKPYVKKEPKENKKRLTDAEKKQKAKEKAKDGEEKDKKDLDTKADVKKSIKAEKEKKKDKDKKGLKKGIKNYENKLTKAGMKIPGKHTDCELAANNP